VYLETERASHRLSQNDFCCFIRAIALTTPIQLLFKLLSFFTLISCIGDTKFSSYNYLKMCNLRTDPQLVARADILREVLLIRDGILAFSSDLFDVTDTNDLILSLAR